MKSVKICVVVRSYDETGDYIETRSENVSCENLPSDIMNDLLKGKVICVKVAPHVEAFYFVKPKDWTDNWTEIGGHNFNGKNIKH